MLGFPMGPGYAWCRGGFHISAVADLTSAEGGLYCASHMPKDEPPDNQPDPAGDPPHIGQCCARGCKGDKPIWQVPNDGRWYCAEHLLKIMRIAWWKP